MNVLYTNGAKSDSLVGVSFYNPTFLYGISCFEGVRAYWVAESRKLVFLDLEDHLLRLYNSSERLSLLPPLSVARLRAEILLIAEQEMIQEDVYIRITFFLGGDGSWHSTNDIHYMISFRSMPSELGRRAPAAVGISKFHRIAAEAMPASVKAGANYLNSRYGMIDVRSRGFDDALFLTRTGLVAEATGSTIFFIKDGGLHTPSLDCDILAGITRARLLRLCQQYGISVRELKIQQEQLPIYEGAFLSGTMVEIRPVSRLNDKVYDLANNMHKKVVDLFQSFIKETESKSSVVSY